MPLPTNYTDQNGNLYTNFTSNGTVTPFGYHFQNALATTQFVADVIWLTCFTSVILWICCCRRRKDAREKVFNAGVIATSTACMVLIYAMAVYNRIVHEIRKPIRWYYPAIISVGTSILTGFANGLLIAFLLWQLVPILLLYANASQRRSKYVVHTCQFLTAIVNLVDFAETGFTAAIWILRLMNIMDETNKNSQGQTETVKRVSSISNLNDAALTAGYNGLYLICLLIFAGVAWKAIRHLQRQNILHRGFRLHLSILTVALILRSLLDFIWALVFKLGRLYQGQKLDDTLVTAMVYTLFYGLFSAIIYVCILCISTVPIPEGIDHDNVIVEHLSAEQKKWFQQRQSNASSSKPNTYNFYGAQKAQPVVQVFKQNR